MIVSIVTPVFNCEDFVRDCVLSVRRQDYAYIEHIIVDGGSFDGTVRIINENAHPRLFLVSEPDAGLYDAINKGIDRAKGIVLGILNADDCLANTFVISSIVNQFSNNLCNGVYGNLIYTKRNNISKISRKWTSDQYFPGKLSSGWMPPHPTLYIKTELFAQVGVYSSEFGSSGDYEFMLRLFSCHEFSATYLNMIVVIMREGGMSNGSLKKAIITLRNDFKILLKSNVGRPIAVLAMKKIRKLSQFLDR
ncbi:MAG: glycosyltransferase family 2 protein [Bacteroidota bacterium]